MAQIQQVSQQSSVASENAQKAYLQEQMQILQKDIPDFADEKKGCNLGKNWYIQEQIIMVTRLMKFLK